MIENKSLYDRMLIMPLMLRNALPEDAMPGP